MPFMPKAPAAAMRMAPAPGAGAHPAKTRAGMGAIAAACGAALGGVLGGPLGIGAGVAAVGAARNIFRSQGIASSDSAQQSESVRSLALGVVGLGIAGYLAYKIYSSKDDDE